MAEKKKSGEKVVMGEREIKGGRPQLVTYWQEHVAEYQQDKQEILRQMGAYLETLQKPQKKEKKG